MLRPLACLALALLLLASAAPPAPAEATTTHPRVVLLELHTAAWCPGCAVADAAVERLQREQGDALAVVAYHPGFWVGDGAPDPRRDDWSSNDPFGTPDVDAYQRNATDELVFPTVVVNGVDVREGPATVERDGRSGVDATMAIYREMVAAQRGDSPVALSLAPPEMDNATVNLTATVTTTPGAANLTLRLVLFESSVWWWGWNGDGTPASSTNDVRLHHFTARALTPAAAVAGNGSFTHAVTLPRDARWNPAHLGAAAFVRDNDTGAVAQAAAQYPDAGGADDAPAAGALAATGGLVLAAVWQRRWSGGGARAALAAGRERRDRHG